MDNFSLEDQNIIDSLPDDSDIFADEDEELNEQDERGRHEYTPLPNKSEEDGNQTLKGRMRDVFMTLG